jgi:hypothetical protein
MFLKSSHMGNWMFTDFPYGMTIFMIVTMPKISVEGTLNAYSSCHQYTFSCLQLPSNHQGIGVCGVYLGAPQKEGISVMRFPLFFIHISDIQIIIFFSDWLIFELGYLRPPFFSISFSTQSISKSLSARKSSIW